MNRVTLQITQNRNNFNKKNAEKQAVIARQNATQQKLTAAKTWVDSLKKSIHELEKELN